MHDANVMQKTETEDKYNDMHLYPSHWKAEASKITWALEFYVSLGM